MKIAFITDDEKTISRHFGRAPYYLVIEVEDNKIVSKERRDKLGHSNFAEEGHHHNSSQGSGMDSESHNKHDRMSRAISDCDVLICGGMGMGAYQSMQTFGITPLVTDLVDIDEALKMYLAGDLEDRTEMLH